MNIVILNLIGKVFDVIDIIMRDIAIITVTIIVTINIIVIVGSIIILQSFSLI